MDGQFYVAIAGNSTLAGLSEGEHRVVVYANNTSGYMGKSNTVYFAIHIPKPPVANFIWSPFKPEVGETVNFDGTSSTSNGTSIVNYTWSFGDGAKASGDKATHSYSAVGNYAVTLNVTNTDDLWDVKSQQIEVVPLPLSVTISPVSASIPVKQSLMFTSSISGGYPPYYYHWYLNSNPISGATSNNWVFNPPVSGTYYVYLKVTDAYNNVAQSNTARITVMSTPVGGYSFSFDKYAIAEPSAFVVGLALLLGISFIAIRRKTKRRK